MQGVSGSSPLGSIDSNTDFAKATVCVRSLQLADITVAHANSFASIADETLN
tara:strand:+ start:1393 stop:1548 length:156 start_codon:yes stop_codon:yes gene_type:complete